MGLERAWNLMTLAVKKNESTTTHRLNRCAFTRPARDRALRGDSDQDVRERAGHADFETTLLYIRRGHLARASAATGSP
jgi:hypothetical protein